MNLTGHKSFILFFSVFFAVILCGTVSATNSVSVTSSHIVINPTLPKLIDSGFTYTKGYIVKKNKYGEYSTGTSDQAYPGMKYPTKYYWKTYLYPNGKIVVYTNFYHTSLKRTIYQKVVIGTVLELMNNNGLYKYMVYESVTPKSWGGSSYWTLTGYTGTPLNFYWHPHGKQHSFRYYLIKNAPEGPG